MYREKLEIVQGYDSNRLAGMRLLGRIATCEIYNNRLLLLYGFILLTLI